MGLSNKEKNRRKRERKKRQKEEERQRQLDLETKSKSESTKEQEEADDVEIEYVTEDLPSLEMTADEKSPEDDDDTGNNSIAEMLRRFHERSTILVSDDEGKKEDDDDSQEDERYLKDEDEVLISKKKFRLMNRPTIAELKNKVERADLVEAHDVTSSDPEFLLYLKALPGTVPVPRHWGRKRKYLQGKRGIEKAPFQLPDFIAKTGISDVRSALDEDESKQNAKQKNRSRVAPKMGALDVDYRTLHDAFFKHQNKASIQDKLTNIGDLYYEGKEFETQKSKDFKIGGALSTRLRDALGMTAENSPPPWLINMQRFGPPPSYPSLSIPGLNAALPAGCSYGYHLNGWGKPPVDAFGRPLYGGNPFDAPGTNASSSTENWDMDAASGAIVTSDGKTVGKKPWGNLPMAAIDMEDDEDESSDEESDDDSSSEEEMAESDEEEETEKATGDESGAVPDVSITPALDLRKQPGDETPAPAQQLYQVIQQTGADKSKQAGAVFASDVAYVVPGTSAPKVPEGAESVLSKAPLDNSSKRKRENADDDDDADLGKKFKF
mmetsp:Transcript_1891/g.2281  ORF Transcript_1891/g.2281 Transcript_1891/m.2281 type:complete len:552 (-) Transcript_1891:45-1700(-)